MFYIFLSKKHIKIYIYIYKVF